MEKCNVCGKRVQVSCEDLEFAQDIECPKLPKNLRQSKEEYEKESGKINKKANDKTGKDYYW